MNIEKLKILRDRIANAPPEQFTYEDYFAIEYDAIGQPIPEWYQKKLAPPCGTAGCVAGHCIMEFGWGPQRSVYDDSVTHLDLGYVEADALFLEAVDRATKEDAVRRLDYLIENRTFRGYDFTQEDGYRKYRYFYDNGDELYIEDEDDSIDED